MKRPFPIFLGMLAVCAGAIAQTTEETIDRALAAAPRQLHDGATVNQVEGRWNVRNAEEGYEPAGLL